MGSESLLSSLSKPKVTSFKYVLSLPVRGKERRQIEHVFEGYSLGYRIFLNFEGKIPHSFYVVF